MIKKMIILSLLLQISIAQLILPENNSNLNYTHIMFEWNQMENADQYQIHLSENTLFSSILVDTISESLIYIDKDNIDWDSQYYWRIRPIDDNNNLGEWSNTHSFSTVSKRSNADAVVYDSENTQQGLTIFSSFFDYFSAMIDQNGNEVWNTEDNNLVYYTTDGYGNLYGTQFSINEDDLPGIDFSIDNNILWSNTGDSYVHHDFFKLPNGNYIGLSESHQNGPIPEDINQSVLFQFQMIGYPTYPTSDLFIFPWVGDEIVEWDEEGNVVWSWNTFDYLDWLQDYDLLGDLWLEAYQMGRHDWTHSNALWFSEEESSIYLSSRHLSRIIKIDYPSGNIIWQMGLDMPSEDVDCGHDLNYSFQHSIQILDNGNLVTLDNGNNSQAMYGTEHPTTRALEIAITETSDGCEANIVWEYTLPQELFGFASGNVQKLDNGNYLITTVGGGATSLEIKPTGESSGDIVWQGNYNLAIPSGAVYRAHRVSGLYPIAFSVTANDYNIEGESLQYPISEDTSEIGFKIWNDGDRLETFNYSINNNSGSIEIEPQSFHTIYYMASADEDINLTITPLHRSDLSKTLSLTTVLDQSLSNDFVPVNFILKDPYPNPFNPITTIEFYTPKPSHIELNIYNSDGKFVENLENNYISSGHHSYKWNAKDMSSGVYLIELKAYDFKETRKIILVK